MPINQPTGEKFIIDSTIQAIELKRNSEFKKWIGTNFYSLYKEGDEEQVQDDTIIEPSSILYILKQTPSFLETIMYEHMPENYYCAIESRYVRQQLIASDRLSDEFEIRSSCTEYSFSIILPNKQGIIVSVPTELNEMSTEDNYTFIPKLYTINLIDSNYRHIKFDKNIGYDVTCQFESIDTLIDELLRLADI